MLYVVSLQRMQEPINLQVRRLSAVTRELLSCPKKLVHPAMMPTDEGDVHGDSGYRRFTGDADDDENGARHPRGTPATAWQHAWCEICDPPSGRLLQVTSTASTLQLSNGLRPIPPPCRASGLEDCGQSGVGLSTRSSPARLEHRM